MSRNLKNFRQFLGAPTLGVDFRAPLFNMDGQLSPFMFNFSRTSGRLTKRNPHSQWIDANLTGTVGQVLPGLVVQPGVGGTINEAGLTANTPAELDPPYIHYAYFNSLYYVAGETGGAGAVYAVNTIVPSYTAGLTFTYTAANIFKTFPIANYRQRLYVGSGTELFYAPSAGAVAGAMLSFSLNNFAVGTIDDIATLSITGGFAPEHYLVIAGTTGVILVYAGSYPGDSTWTLVNQFRIPINLQSLSEQIVELIPVPNDVLVNVVASSQIYSLRGLMTDGLASDSIDILAAVRPLFEATSLIPSAPTDVGKFTKSGAYQAYDGSLIVACRFFGDNSLLRPWNDANLMSSDVNYIPLEGYSLQSVLIQYSFGEGVISLHDVPYLGGNFSKLVEYQGLVRVFSSGYNTGPGVPQGSLTLFDNVTTTRQDYDVIENELVNYNAVAKLSPLPAPYTNRLVHNLLMYSNLSSDHSFQYQCTDQFDRGNTDFKPFSTSSTDENIKATVLDGYGSGNTNVIGVLESSAAENFFELYGIDVLYEQGGEW